MNKIQFELELHKSIPPLLGNWVRDIDQNTGKEVLVQFVELRRVESKNK